MKTTIIGGRQGTGKTGNLIEYLSSVDGTCLLFSFDHKATDERYYRISPNIKVIDGPSLNFENLVNLVKEQKPKTVAIDSVEVLPDSMASHDLVEKLKGYCDELVITSHLEDNEELNDIATSMVEGEEFEFRHV